MSQPDSHSTFRFGEFELDISAYELRRGGQPVHLERQPMDLLILLVEHHRQLVSRADIVKRLWDPGVFVDVEMGVNTAIRKLRQALRDSRESPAFVETISGKGYRFIAPVNAVLLGRQQEAIESVAVLPFANDSADPDAEYLSDGITETLINNLSQIWNLRVVARSTVFRYEGKDIDPHKAGNDLHVRAVVSGRLLQRGSTLTIRAELMDVATAAQRWGGQYNRKAEDVFALQDDLPREISEKLRLQLTGDEKQRLTKRYTEDAEAYRLYLKGRYHWNKRSPEGLQKAVALNPAYSRAHSVDPSCRCCLARSVEALEGARRALDFDPATPAGTQS